MMRIALGLVIVAAGCGASKDNAAAKPEAPAPSNQAAPASNDPMDIAIAGLTDWKTKMCACTDAACADRTHEGYKTWENDVLEPMFRGKEESDIPKDKLAIAENLDDERKACRRTLRDSGGASTADAMAKMAEFRDMMCACKDAECAKTVSDDMTKWSQEQARTSTEPPKMTQDDIKQATEIGTQMGECMQKAMGIGP